MSAVCTIPLFFPESNPDFVNVCSPHFSLFFSGEKTFVFFLSAKIYGALLHLMACWSTSDHFYHIYFLDCPLFLNFYFIDSTPFFSHCIVSYGVFLIIDIDHLYHLGEQQQCIFKGYIDQHFCYLLLHPGKEPDSLIECSWFRLKNSAQCWATQHAFYKLFTLNIIHNLQLELCIHSMLFIFFQCLTLGQLWILRLCLPMLY